MKAKLISFLAGAVGVMTILLTAYQPVDGAPPTGEVRTVASVFGNQILIPYLETTHANDIMQLLYDHLVCCTPQGKLSPELGLAHKWEMSPDGLTWAFYIRKGVKFHDGVELTAKDVKFSIEQVIRPDSLMGDAVFIRKDVKSIEVKDAYTVVIHCKQPDMFLPNLLSNLESTGGMVVPKDYYERVGKDEFAKHPIGSGPYKFHSSMAGSFTKLEAMDNHWRDGIPRYKYMTYLLIPEEFTRVSMLRTGQADITRISRESAREALNMELNLITKDNGGVIVFHPNMQWASPAFSDIRFRKALNLAIDKEAIIKQLFSGLAKPVATWPGSSISAVGGDPNLKPYPYDPKEAERLIKGGGWEGYEFTFISYERAGCPEFTKVVETLAGYWQKIGLKPTIRMSEWAAWRQVWNDRKTQNTIHGYDDTINPEVSTILGKAKEKWYFKNSRSTVNIPDLNGRFDKIEKSMDIAEISNLLIEIYRYAYDHYLMIPICEFPDLVATTKRIPKWDTGLRRNDRNYYGLIKQR